MAIQMPEVQWVDAATTPAAAFPALAHMPAGQQRVERAMLDGHPLPVVALKVEASDLRAPLGDHTEAQVTMDLVTVQPHPTPIAYVLTVLFDDLSDPFFYMSVVHSVHPATMHGKPILHDRSQGRQQARRRLLDFCDSQGACGLLVLDARNEVLLARLVDLRHGFLVEPGERRAEIREAVEFLNGFELQRDLRELEAIAQALYATLWLPVCGPDGVYRSVPPHRQAGRLAESIFPVRVRHGRLVTREAREPPPQQDFRHDVFISHAHTDAAAAAALGDWIRRLFPTARISVTDPAATERFEDDPRFFLLDSLHAACLLYLATPNSIGRPMVQVELSHNPHKPIITALAGGLNRFEVEQRLRTDPFIALDRARLVDVGEQAGWARLALLLEVELGTQASQPPDPAPPLAISHDTRTAAERWADYQRDWLTISRAFKRAQTKSQAAVDVSRELARLQSLGYLSDGYDEFDPETKLVAILDITQPTLVPFILDFFPALVHDGLVRLALEVAVQCEAASPPDAAGAARMRHIARCAEQRLQTSRAPDRGP